MIWETRGFEAFRRGTFGNGGQNLYVSKAGVLQRIYQYDLNHNGYFDLLFANCQDHHESAPSYCYTRDGRRSAVLPAQGALSGCVADLTGSGFQDVVVAGHYDMAMPYAYTDIYFGSGEDYSQDRHIRIPTPFSVSAVPGDFQGCGYPSLAFAMPVYKTVRIFPHTELGVEWSNFTDLPIEANLLAAGDLDGDGYDELLVQKKDSTAITIYWGGKDGISIADCTEIPEVADEEIQRPDEVKTLESNMEKRWQPFRLIQCVKVLGKTCVSFSTGKKVVFYAVDEERRPYRHLELEVPMALSVAVGDINGDGIEDIAVACQAPCPEDEGSQYSYVFLGDGCGFPAEKRFPVKTRFACDAVIADWDGDGRGEIIFAQGTDINTYTNRTASYRWDGKALVSGSSCFETEDARRIFFIKRPGGESEVCVINHYARSAVGFDKAYIYWGGKDGYSADRMAEVPCWCAVDSIYADLDDDGWAELVVCNNSENSLHLDPGFHICHFNENGYVPEKTTLLPTKLGWGGVCADFDRDGYLDLIVSGNMWDSLLWFHGGPDGWREEEIKITENKGAIRWIAAADLNNNGYLDLIVPLITEDRSLILFGGPDGYSLERSQKLGVFNGVAARVADLTGNGFGDVIIGSFAETSQGAELTPHNPHHSFIHIYWNDGHGLRENNKAVFKADSGVAMAIGDFNGDGWLDIFVSNYHNGVERDINSIIYWNREGHFQELDRQLLFTHSASGCIAADFNEDGYVDLAVANHKVDGDHKGFSTVWWNGPKGFNRERTTDLPTNGPHGMTAIEPGNILTRGPEEFYYSEPYTVEKSARVSRVETEGEIPPKTWVRAMLRHAACLEELERAEWVEPGMEVKAGELLQYRLELGAVNSLRSPRITGVKVYLD